MNTVDEKSASKNSGNASGFSCFLVGEGSLLIRCADILNRSDCRIEGIISPDAINHDWARKHTISCYHPENDLFALMRKKPFDYLFSIVNSHILPAKVLGLPQKLAINYHDSLLPRYAGVYATAWAIINQEKTHGVSWHLMSDGIDTGDIVKQAHVIIEPTETSLSLNAKCYEKAAETFNRLVQDLLTDKVTPIRQDLTRRTYYPLFMRPKSACVVDFNQAAANIDTFVRGLTFGETYPNKLGLPKLYDGKNFFILRKVKPLTSVSNQRAGTIIDASKTSLTISTTTHDIAIEKIDAIDGHRIPIEDFSNKLHLTEAGVLEKLNPATDALLTQCYPEISRYEPYWINRLLNYPPATIPYAKQTLSDLSKESARVVPFAIPEKFVSFLDKNNLGEDIRECVISAFAAYLGRLSGTPCFSIGFKPPDSQNWPPGIFSRYVPLGVDLDFTGSFPAFKSQMQAEMAGALKYKTFARDLPLRYPELKTLPGGTAATSQRVAVSLVEKLEDYQKRDNACLDLVISTTTARCLWAYHPEMLSEANVTRMMSQLACFMRDIARAPEKPVRSLALMTDDERHEILVAWNRSRTDYPENVCIHALFENWAARAPDEVAVVCENDAATYRQINDQANRLAHELIKRGVGPEVLVGLCLERGIPFIVAMLGVLKAGGAYVPIDIDYPPKRIFFMIEDSGLQVFVTQEKMAPTFSGLRVPMICLDSAAIDLAVEQTDTPRTTVADANLAYLMYTSGSTGRPKGVMITHRNVVAFLYSYKQVTLDGEKRIGTTVAPFSFDTSVEEIYATICFGGTLHIIEPQKSADTEYFADYLLKHRITTTYIVPDFLPGVAKALNQYRNHLNLRCLITGLAPKKEKALQCFRDLSENMKILNAYGPTEVTYGATAYDFKSACDPERFVPIGVSFPNYEVYIVDSNLQPVPVGVSGELLIGGVGLARGYLNRPALTDEKFISHPFTSELGAKLYRTGDLVRFLTDGNIEFIGRIDRQVKIRGHRIELAEIENVLEKHASIEKAVVVTRADKSTNPYIVAYFLCERNLEPTVTNLRNFLGEELPAHMLPSIFMRLETLPFLPNGKLDYLSLPAPAHVRPHLENPFVAPRRPEEEKLAAVMAKILGVDKIGIYDDFFELGGDSLAAVQMAAEIEQAFGKKVPLSILVQATTIERLHQVLGRDALLEQTRQTLVELTPGNSTPAFFCVHSEGGNILEYREFSKQLGSDQPFQGFQALGTFAEDLEPVTIESMATCYIEAMKQKQPTGPYYLGGYCLGGLIAFEMARQLGSAGEEIAFLGLISTATPEYLLNRNSHMGLFEQLCARIIDRTKLELDNISTSAGMERARYLKHRARQVCDFALVKMEAIIWRLFKRHNVGRAKHSRAYNTAKLISFQNAAYFEYRSRPIKSPITVFRAGKDSLPLMDDPTLGFGAFSETGAVAYEIDCFHKNILKRPNAEKLAKPFRACLDNAQAAQEPSSSAMSRPFEALKRPFTP